jgi:hypothetical protein
MSAIHRPRTSNDLRKCDDRARFSAANRDLEDRCCPSVEVG